MRLLIQLLNAYKIPLKKSRLAKKCMAFKGNNCDTMFGELRDRFHYERKMEHSLFVSLICFASILSACLDFKPKKINKRNKECSISRS